MAANNTGNMWFMLLSRKTFFPNLFTCCMIKFQIENASGGMQNVHYFVET